MFIDPGLFRQRPSTWPPMPILVVIAMDAVIVLAFVGYSLSRGLFS